MGSMKQRHPRSGAPLQRRSRPLMTVLLEAAADDVIGERIDFGDNRRQRRRCRLPVLAREVRTDWPLNAGLPVKSP